MFVLHLPEDIVLHISGYYGNKIKNDLSQEIKDQRLLYSIKEQEYYNATCKTWHIDKLCRLFLELPCVPSQLKKQYSKVIWKDQDKLIINRIWRLCNSNERNEIAEKHFPCAFFNEAEFITFREFAKSKNGYFVN
jgi:hypothetical protein